jgi:hypothetical protein
LIVDKIRFKVLHKVLIIMGVQSSV